MKNKIVIGIVALVALLVTPSLVRGAGTFLQVFVNDGSGNPISSDDLAFDFDNGELKVTNGSGAPGTMRTDFFKFNTNPNCFFTADSFGMVMNGCYLYAAQGLYVQGATITRGPIKNDQQLYTEIGGGQGKVVYANADALGVGIPAATAGVDINSPKPITYSCQSKTPGRGCCEKREFSNGQGSFYTTYENVNGVIVEHRSIQTPPECQFQP